MLRRPRRPRFFTLRAGNNPLSASRRIYERISIFNFTTARRLFRVSVKTVSGTSPETEGLKMSVETNNATDLQGIIARRAYELYQLRGGVPGREFEDWLEAEREVLSALPAAEEAPAPRPARKRAAKTPAAATTTRKRTARKKEEE